MSPKLSRRAVTRFIAAKLANEPAASRHWLKTLAAYLVETKQAEAVDLYINDIADEYFTRTGTLLVEVTSVRPLKPAARTELERYIRTAAAAKKIILNERRDRELVGGLVARTPSAALDASVRAQLKQLAALRAS